jgi:hypothetical protein
MGYKHFRSTVWFVFNFGCVRTRLKGSVCRYPTQVLTNSVSKRSLISQNNCALLSLTQSYLLFPLVVTPDHLTRASDKDVIVIAGFPPNELLSTQG